MKLIVIGGGPGGYVAAIRGAQLGAQVVLVEKKRLGGTCLNIGCIPTKVILHGAELWKELEQMQEYGIQVKEKSFDWSVLQEKKGAVTKRLTDGVAGLLKANKVQVIQGIARFKGERVLEIEKQDGTRERLEGDKIIIAAGSTPASLPIPGIGKSPSLNSAESIGKSPSTYCMDSTEALSVEKVPESLLVIGGGVIGIELAEAFNAFGSKVTVVEAMPKLLPMMDGELTKALQGMLEQKGIQIHTETKVIRAEEGDEGAAITAEIRGEQKVFYAEKVLVAVGRRADTSELGLDTAGITNDRGRIQVDEYMRTNVPDVYAIGDCLGKTMLAHVASAQGETAAEHAMGHDSVYRENTNPSCIYTEPEFAGVGLTEEQCRERKIRYLTGKFPMAANGKALIANGGAGMVKVLLGEKYHEILGVHILGPRATEIIGECALGIGLEATAEEFIHTIHAHPTVSEVIREAVLAAEGRAIHITN